MRFLRKLALRYAMGGSRQKQSEVIGAILRHFGPGAAQFMAADIDSFIELGYGSMPVAYACVNEIATRAAAVPLLVKRRTSDGLEAVPESGDAARLVRIVTRQPNAQQGKSEFIEQALTDKLIGGEVFIEKTLTGDRAVSLYPWGGHRIKLNLGRTAAAPIESYELVDVYSREPFTPEQIVHCKYYNPDNYWRGMSPMAAARRAIQQSLGYDDWNVSLAQNKGFTGGIMKFSDEPSPEQKDDIDEWIEGRSGPANAGKVLKTGSFLEDFITEGLVNPTDADWLEGDESAGVKVCMVYNVPPEVIGLGDKTYANYETAEKALYDRAVVPSLRNLCEELTRGVAATYGDEYVILPDVDAIDALQEDRAKRDERLREDFRAGAITREEYREATGRDPEPNGGTFYVPAGSLPVPAGAEMVDVGEGTMQQALEHIAAFEKQYNGALN